MQGTIWENTTALTVRKGMRSVRNNWNAMPADIQGHCRWVAVYARVIGEQVEGLVNYFPEVGKQELYSALHDGGYFHDLGKSMFSTSLLHKPGKLSEAEWQSMKNHPARAREILLADSDFMRTDRHYQTIVLESCVYHHERCDGSGYPYGLKGSDVPLHAQLVGICDVLDALTSYRPYKKTQSFEESYSYLTQDCCHQFSPVVMDAFIRSKDTLYGIYETQNRRSHRAVI